MTHTSRRKKVRTHFRSEFSYYPHFSAYSAAFLTELCGKKL